MPDESEYEIVIPIEADVSDLNIKFDYEEADNIFMNIIWLDRLIL